VAILALEAMPPGSSLKYAFVHVIHSHLQGLERSHLITSLITGENGELYTREGRVRDTTVSS